MFESAAPSTGGTFVFYLVGVCIEPVPDLGLVATLRTIGRNIGRVAGSMAAGQRAASDYRRLNSRTDAQTAADSISRADVARIVFERHFD